jgi:bla regulator protein blaR1
MRIAVVILVAAGTSGPALHAQPPAVVTPKFEVASIRPCDGAGFAGLKGGGTSGPGGGSVSPGRVRFACGSLVNFIQRAYVTFANGRSNSPWGPSPQIEGGPAWKNTERYTINAKAEGNASLEMMSGPMLQALLEERFKLRVRHETREVPAYALTVAKSGLKLPRVEEGSCTPFDRSNPPAARVAAPGQKPFCGNGGFGKKDNLVVANIPAIGLDEFANRLGGRLDRPVINKTGVKGLFDFHLEFGVDQTTPKFLAGGDLDAPPVSLSDPPGGPSIFTAVQQQLGLKLEPAKGPGEFLVIDHVERPSEN